MLLIIVNRIKYSSIRVVFISFLLFMFSQLNQLPNVSFNMASRRGPYGGGNQWLKLTRSYFDEFGYKTSTRLTRFTDCVLATHAGFGYNSLSYTFEHIGYIKIRNPNLKVIQRINDNDIRKSTTNVDLFLSRSNSFADHTVFVSDWLLDYHSSVWFDKSKPHSVIRNAADSAIFNPYGSIVWDRASPLRLVTHHWSNNLNKGFEFYSKIDTLIASGVLSNVELWIIGNYPSSFTWRAAKLFPPCTGLKLAHLIKQCHVHVTASLYEPGAMHPIEALQCGLPIIYTSNTGGTVEVASNYGVLADTTDPQAAINYVMDNYLLLRKKAISNGSSGLYMAHCYHQLAQNLLLS